jgi:hypothetical protein
LRGFGYYTEARDYVPFYKDLVTHLAWNPRLILDDFTVDYCQRRYEPSSVDAMVACHEKLIKTVYGPRSDTHLVSGFRTVRAQDPVYWFALGDHWAPFDVVQENVARMRAHWAPILRDALADALSVYDQEKDNLAYIRDLADIMRSYVQVKINQAVWDAADAARRGDREAFDSNYALIDRLFDRLLAAINLVSDRWEYGVNALVEDFADGPVGQSPVQVRHHLYYVTFGGSRIHNYFRGDRYEMIRDIYRPMTMAALDGMRENVGKESALSTPTASTSVGNYATIMDVVREKAHVASSSQQQAIIDRFIAGPCDPPPAAPDARSTVESFLEAIARSE